MKVYKIKLDGEYVDYFVTANDFNEAERKIILQKEKEKQIEKSNIFTSDGSLNPYVTGNGVVEKPVVVKIIEMLTDNIIS